MRAVRAHFQIGKKYSHIYIILKWEVKRKLNREGGGEGCFLVKTAPGAYLSGKNGGIDRKYPLPVPICCAIIKKQISDDYARIGRLSRA